MNEIKTRCTSEVFDGWEDTDRCLLDKHTDDIPHNYLNPGDDPKLRSRFSDNNTEGE